MTREAAHERHVELLLGRVVRDAVGLRVGRIEEIVAKKDGDEFVVSHYLVGPAAWFQRVAVRGLGLRGGRLGQVYRIEWDQMDLTEPLHPRATGPRDQLHVEHLPPRKRGLTRRPARRMA
jgi:hypothetical protein